MKKLTIDLHDYIEGGSVYKRMAVRGIIQKDKKYLLIYSKYGDHKFPGGGLKQGESFEETLLREVQEETGYIVKKESISEGILVKEKRKGDPDDLLEMDSYYFFCDIFETIGDRNLDDYEAEYDYKVSWMTLEEAIKNNESVKDYENIPWIKRETMIMTNLLENRGIGYAAIQMVLALYPKVITWRLATILQEKRDCHFYEKCGFYRSGWKKEINELMDVVGYEKVLVMTRRFCKADAEEVAGLIIRNFKEINSKDYGKDDIDERVKKCDSEWVKERASYANMYVFCLNEQILGVGSISSFWGSQTESILLTIFVLPEFQGKGIGRTIIKTLEQDELFIRAERVEIPASITAVDFYREFGYEFKNGVKELDKEGTYRLEKYNYRECIENEN